MRKTVLIAALLILVLGATAQNQETERLLQEIKSHPHQDTFRVNRLNELANNGNLSPNETMKLANEALGISQKTGYKVGEGYAKMNLASVQTQNGNRQEAAVLLKQADSIAVQTGDPELQINILQKMIVNTQQTNNKQALDYGMKAEELAQKTGNKTLLSQSQRMIATMYLNSFSDYSKAMEYSIKSVSAGEEAGCLSCLASSWSTLASLYNLIGDQNKSLAYYQKSLEANKQLGNKGLKNQLLINIGERYRLMGKYPQAIASYKEGLAEETSPYRIELVQSNLADVYVRTDSLPLAFAYGFTSLATAKKIDDIEGVAWIDGILSRAYLKKQMPDSALYYARHGLDAAKQTGTIEFMRDNAEALVNAYVFRNDFRNAYDYHNLYISYRDSMLNAEVSNKSMVLEYNYNIAKKQAEITALNQQQKLQRNFLISVSVVLLLIIITAIALFKNNRQKQKALAELKQAQTQLIQAEKMASLGELTAGIAHEIQNPLNFVNNFSEVSNEMLDEMKTDLATGNLQQATEIANELQQNLEKILHHGKRADAIVKGMLQHSRVSTGQKESISLNTLTDEYLRLSYHGMRATDKSFNATLQTDFDTTIGKIDIVPQDIGRMLLNLYNNAFYAVSEKKNILAKSYAGVNGYEPTVTISTKKNGNKVLIAVRDNGNGIPRKVLDKIFQPFFTTKPTGQGTGLGLSLSYDIVKAHGGDIKVDTKEGGGSEFTIHLPA